MNSYPEPYDTTLQQHLGWQKHTVPEYIHQLLRHISIPQSLNLLELSKNSHRKVYICRISGCTETYNVRVHKAPTSQQTH